MAQITRLAQFIREWRERTGLSQDELQRELQVDLVQYVHKIETGKVKRPSANFLEKFSVLAGKSVDELEAMAGRPAHDRDEARVASESIHAPDEFRNPDRYQVAFGHVIWAAPLVLAALRGELNDRFQFSSFALAPATHNFGQSGSMTFADLTALSGAHDGGLTELRDRLVWASRGCLVKNCPGPGAKGIETLSAREVRQLLNRKKVHVIAAPGELLGRQRSFERVATMVDSATGCVMLHRYARNETTLTTEQLGTSLKELRNSFSTSGDDLRSRTISLDETLRHLDPDERDLLEKSGGKAICIAAEDETVAAVYADEIAKCVFRHETRDGHDLLSDFRVSIETGFIHEWTLASLRRHFLETRGKVLVGVVAWEPQTSWLEKESDLSWHRVLLQRTPHGRRPEHLTFELAVPALTEWHPDFRRAFDRLLTEVWTCADEIALLHQRTADRQTIWWLARYFGYTTSDSPATMPASEGEQLLNALSEVRYHVYPDLLSYRKIAPETRGTW